MSAVVPTEVSWGTAMTVADLDALPDDGRRHELVDGTLIVTPASSWGHQRAQMRLLRHLLPLVPADHELFVAPLDVRISDTTNLQPDILIARIADMTEANLPTAPVLVVEVLSPSTRRRRPDAEEEHLRGARHPALLGRRPARAVDDGVGTV